MSTLDVSPDRGQTRPRIAGARPSYSRNVRRIRGYAQIAPTGSSARRAAITLALVVGSALLASSGAIHLQLWSMGYRTIPTIGPLFLLQGIVGVLLAVLLLIWRRLLVVVAGAGFMVATVGGLLVSVNFGLFGFMDTFAAPYAGLSLVLEITGAVVLGVVGTVLVRGDRRSDLRRSDQRSSPPIQRDRPVP
jgi:hypothetical protein